MIDYQKVSRIVELVTKPAGKPATVQDVFASLLECGDERYNVAVYMRLLAIDQHFAASLLGGSPSLTRAEVDSFARRIQATPKRGAEKNKILRQISYPDMWLVRARMIEIRESDAHSTAVPFVLKVLS
jgi:hypothetical protein